VVIFNGLRPCGDGDVRVRQFADHPVVRHWAAPPQNVVTAEQAANLLRPYFRDESSLYVSSGEKYGHLPIYNLRILVPLEQMWFVSASLGPPGRLDGVCSLIAISKRTGEILFATSNYEGG